MHAFLSHPVAWLCALVRVSIALTIYFLDTKSNEFLHRYNLSFCEGFFAYSALQVLDGCLQLLRERRVLDGLLTECKAIASTIQSLVGQLQNSKAREGGGGGGGGDETERGGWLGRGSGREGGRRLVWKT